MEWYAIDKDYVNYLKKYDEFVPNNAVKVKIDDFNCNIKLIDCVGYLINDAKGVSDENGPRMVKTPWEVSILEIPFMNM